MLRDRLQAIEDAAQQLWWAHRTMTELYSHTTWKDLSPAVRVSWRRTVVAQEETLLNDPCVELGISAWTGSP